MPSKHCVIVSPEMTTFVGPGACDRLLLPPDALLIGFGDVGEPVVRTLAFRELESEAHLLVFAVSRGACRRLRSEEHTSELQSLMRISYAVFCLKNQHQTYTNVSSKQ